MSMAMFSGSLNILGADIALEGLNIDCTESNLLLEGLGSDGRMSVKRFWWMVDILHTCFGLLGMTIFANIC
jgi:hypothetical protein